MFHVRRLSKCIRHSFLSTYRFVHRGPSPYRSLILRLYLLLTHPVPKLALSQLRLFFSPFSTSSSVAFFMTSNFRASTVSKFVHSQNTNDFAPLPNLQNFLHPQCNIIMFVTNIQPNRKSFLSIY